MFGGFTILDCTYFLYKALLKQFPYVPADEAEYAVGQLKKAEARLKRAPKHLTRDLLVLIDSTELLANDRARHAFQLGLDAGLSIAQESRHLQQDER